MSIHYTNRLLFLYTCKHDIPYTTHQNALVDVAIVAKLHTDPDNAGISHLLVVDRMGGRAWWRRERGRGRGGGAGAVWAEGSQVSLGGTVGGAGRSGGR